MPRQSNNNDQFEISKYINKMSTILTDDEIDQEIKNAYGYLRFRYEKMVLLNLHLKQVKLYERTLI